MLAFGIGGASSSLKETAILPEFVRLNGNVFVDEEYDRTVLLLSTSIISSLIWLTNGVGVVVLGLDIIVLICWKV